jgi:hypothetical protein
MGAPMALRDVILSDWTGMSDGAARRECEDLARELPHGLTLTSLKIHTYCGRQHRVARFSRREAGELVHFVLVPGGPVSLGCDGHKFKPKDWQIESLVESASALEKRRSIVKFLSGMRYYASLMYQHTGSIEKYVDDHTSAARTTFIRSMLVEMEARDAEARTISADDPAFDALERVRAR